MAAFLAYDGTLAPYSLLRPQQFLLLNTGQHSPCVALTLSVSVAYSWFSHDVTKIQTKKLSLLLSFYFHVILEHLKTFIKTNFRFKRVLCFAIKDA